MAQMQTTGFNLIREYCNNVLVELTEKLTLYPYNNKSGKDMSDLIRGQIIGITEVIKLDQSIKNFEERQKQLNKLREELDKGAN